MGAKSTEGGVWNARDDAGTSTGIPKRDRSTGVKPRLVDPRAKSNLSVEGDLATHQIYVFWGKTG